MNRTLQFEQIESLVHHARKVLVVSDYDGTLAPIAPTPAMAFLPGALAAVRIRAQTLSKHPLVIIGPFEGVTLHDSSSGDDLLLKKVDRQPGRL